jgi:hypothetical protein
MAALSDFALLNTPSFKLVRDYFSDALVVSNALQLTRGKHAVPC